LDEIDPSIFSKTGGRAARDDVGRSGGNDAAREEVRMAKTPEEMAASMVRNLAEKTGRTLEQWIALAGKQKLAKHGEIVKWLKSEHGMGHGYANLVAHQALAASAPAGGEDLVDAQYAGAKAGLRPIYDKLIAAVETFGGDVEISPKKTYVCLRRSKQFALVQPSTASRVDVGIQLKGHQVDQGDGKRLEASGSFNQMVSHRVRLATAGEVDRELVGWLKAAYERA
jgi:predicted transport protein